MSDLNQDDFINATDVSSQLLETESAIYDITQTEKSPLTGRENLINTTLNNKIVEHNEFNFIPFKNEDLELIVDTNSNQAYASISAIARMLNVNKGTLHRELNKAVANYKSITAQIQTGVGLRSVALYTSETVFELAFRYNIELAKKMGAAGANLYMLNLAGFKIKLEETKPVTVNLSNRDLALMVIAEADRADALVAQIEQDKPCTDLGKAIIKADNNIRVGEFAKSLGLGQNRYFAELRECKIIMATSTLPYQRYLDEGYFLVTQSVNNNQTFPVALVTPKGQVYLVKRHQQYIENLSIEYQIERSVSALV